MKIKGYSEDSFKKIKDNIKINGIYIDWVPKSDIDKLNLLLSKKYNLELTDESKKEVKIRKEQEGIYENIWYTSIIVYVSKGKESLSNIIRKIIEDKEYMTQYIQ